MNRKQAQSAILNKILTYDYFCLCKENAATSEFNAAANYDYILPAIAVIACQRLGLAPRIADLLFNSLNKLKHKVRTLYGLSTEYGPWAVIADVQFNTMDGHGAGMVLRDPTGKVISQQSEERYVDDTSLGVDERNVNVQDRLSTSAQQHERILYTTGGKLALQKCMCVLVNWAWSNGVAPMESFQADDEDGATSARLLLVQSKTGEEVEIPRLNPSEAYRTLGAWITADGCQLKQLEVLSEKVSV